MINWFKQRNNWHYIIGFHSAILVYLIAYEAHQMIGRFLIGIILLGFGAIIWEMVREDKWGYKFDWQDVKRSVIGALIGGTLCVIVHSLIIGKFI